MKFHEDRIRLCSLTQIRSPDEERQHFPNVSHIGSHRILPQKSKINACLIDKIDQTHYS